MEYLFLYCLQLFDNLKNINNVIGVIIILFFILFCFIKAEFIYSYLSDEEQKERTDVLTSIKKLIINLIIVFLLLSFIPTKQTLLLIGGTYLGKKAVNQIATSEKLEKINTIINLELDKRIKEHKQCKIKLEHT